MGHEGMSEQPCCGMSNEHPYRDRRHCAAVGKLKLEVVAHGLREGIDQGGHLWEPVVEYIDQLEKQIRSRDAEVRSLRASLEERSALQ